MKTCRVCIYDIFVDIRLHKMGVKPTIKLLHTHTKETEKGSYQSVT